MDELVNRAKNLFTMREYGIITTNEYIEELNKIRKSLGFEKLPVSQIAAQQSVYWTLCHKSPSKTHSWYGSSQGYVCEHCGTRR